MIKKRESRFPERKRYVKGERVKSISEAIRMIDDRLPFYHHNKYMAAGFIEHWSIVQINNAIKAGALRRVQAQLNKIQGD